MVHLLTNIIIFCLKLPTECRVIKLPSFGIKFNANLTILLLIIVEMESKLLATVNVCDIEKQQIMNNKLFTSISSKQQENISGGAAVPTIPGIPAIPTFIYGTTLDSLLGQIFSLVGYTGPIPSSFGF